MLSFRLATKKDFTEVWNVIDNARNIMLETGRRQWTVEYPSRKNILADISNGNAYVIISNERVAAYAAVVVNGEPKYAHIVGEWLSQSDYIVVHRLAVAPEQRRKGLCKMFFREVENLCRSSNICSIKIDTNYDNTEMLSLLPKLGYTQCGNIDYGEKGMRIAFEKLI